MKWTKRLKWIRLSKIIIPIALAITLVFAGFTVYAHEADNFVIRINNDEDVKLSLTLDEDYTKNQTSHLAVPISGYYEDVTYTPDKELLYRGESSYVENLPDDIAKHYGTHSVFTQKNVLSFFSFSFWLVNNSDRAVDVDIRLDVDEMTEKKNESGIHIDEAVRVMIIENEPLLSDNTFTVYKKPERTEEAQKQLERDVGYGNMQDFLSDRCIFNREGDMGIRNMAEGAALKFTVVVWLEGWDAECIDDIRYDSLKMSMEFSGH